MTRVVKHTKIDLEDSYSDFASAWAAVQEMVEDFARTQRGLKIRVDDSTGRVLVITLSGSRGRRHSSSEDFDQNLRSFLA